METKCLILFLLTFALGNSKTINIKISTVGVAKTLVPSPENSAGNAETEWVLEANDGFKIRLFCKMKERDCLRAMLTVDNGLDVISYCGKKALNYIQQSSHKNKMVVTLLTRNSPNSAACQVSAIKSFVDFEEPEVDSSEAGVKQGAESTTCPCGWATKSNGRIVGGKEAKINEFAFPVVIVRKDKHIAFCGGSVITQYHVLTAAHCTYKLKKEVPLIVGVGEHDISSAKETNATQFIPVEKVILHKEFNANLKINDIAILVLKNKIEFNNIVGPVCLPNKKIDLEGKFVRVMGWGRLFDRGIQSNVLMKADLKVIDFSQCGDYYKLQMDDPHQFCTFGHDKDTCSGDSGGPVVWLDPSTNRYTQVGVVSYGIGCATEDIPGVNSEVAYFTEWILKTIKETKPSQTCHKAT